MIGSSKFYQLLWHVSQCKPVVCVTLYVFERRFPDGLIKAEDSQGSRQPIRCNTIVMSHQNGHAGPINGRLLTIRGAVTGFVRALEIHARAGGWTR